MRQLLLCLTVSLALTVAQGQTPNWQWAKTAGGNGYDYISSVSVDDSGNVYVTGGFSSPTITFGSITLINDTINGSGDFFIAKYNNSGNVLWAKSAGGNADDVGKRIKTDFDNNIYVIGYFGSQTITFGGITLVSDTTTPTEDIFVAKYNNLGNVIWARSAGGTYNDEGQSISTDKIGNSYITGIFWSPTITFGSTTLTSSSVEDVFVAKYNSAGNVLWATKGDSIWNDNEGYHISTDAIGNSYVMGQFYNDTIYFNTIPLANANNTFSNDDFFIVKYDSAGNMIWAKREGGIDMEFANGIISDNNGNFYVVGAFYSNTLTLGSTVLTNTGASNTSDIFVVKYDTSGNALWAKQFGDIGSDWASSVSIDSIGNIFVGGVFNSQTITFGSTTLTNDTTGPTEDIFVAKFNNSGNVIWAKSAGGTNIDWCNSIDTKSNDNVYAGGYFTSTSINFDNATLLNAGTYNAFVAKLSHTTGIAEAFDFSNRINIFPNPFSTQTTLRTDSPFHNATLSVDNYLGQTVKQIKNISGQTVVLSRDNLPSGLYFVRLTEENKTIAVDKLVIVDK